MSDTDKAPMQILVLVKDGFIAAFALRDGKGYLVPKWDTLAELARMASTGPRGDFIPVTVTVTVLPRESVLIALECDQEAWKDA